MFATEEPSGPPPRGGRSTLLVERWRPRTLRDLVGQSEALGKLRRFAESWAAGPHPPKLRGALLEGAPGTGKTSAARALAEEYGWGLIEMSASDARNREALQQVAGRAALTNTFTEDGRYLAAAQGGRNLILLDDVDCIPARGGSGEEGSPRFPRTPPSFRDFLRNRYREIAALNQAWGLTGGEEPAPYASFTDLPATAPRGNLGKRPAVRRDVEDWQPQTRGGDLTDRGGLAAVAELLRTTRQPIVLTAIDPRALSRASVVFRTGVVRVRFYPLRDEAVRAHLQRISGQEQMLLPGTTLDTIVRHTKGDLRAALNDLELAGMVHDLHRRQLLSSSVDADQVLGWRDIEQNMFGAVEGILSSPRFFRTGEVLDALNTTPEELLPWIEENIPHHAPGARELADAFDVHARAQHHLARANRWRIWTLWSYATELMTGGVALALHPRGAPTHRPRGSTEFPRFLAGMGSSRGQRQTRDALAQKIGRFDHLSRRKAREVMLPFLEQLFREPPTSKGAHALEDHHRELVRVARDLGLEARELAYLLQVEEDHVSVRHLLHEEHGTPRGEVGAEAKEAPGPSPPTEEKGGGTSPTPARRKGQRTLF